MNPVGTVFYIFWGKYDEKKKYIGKKGKREKEKKRKKGERKRKKQAEKIRQNLIIIRIKLPQLVWYSGGEIS